jgi:hypothetical protein
MQLPNLSIEVSTDYDFGTNSKQNIIGHHPVEIE